MKRKHTRIHSLAIPGGILIVLALLVSACSSGGVPNTGSSGAATAPGAGPTSPGYGAALAATATPAAAGPTTEAVINVTTDAKLGKILTGANGMTLYMFKKDTPDQSNCDANCLKAWPPLVTQGSPTLGDGVDKSLVGTASLADGSKIVTYNHMPLYYFASDSKPGDTNGQGVGDVWYVVSPDGKVVGGGAPAGGAATASAPAQATAGSASTSAPAAASGAVTVNMAQSKDLGNILVDGRGMTLYRFTKDEPNKSNCSGDCLAKWPPLISQGAPVAGSGVDASKLGVIPTADGQQQVTYDGHPLYHWINDKAPGDTTGQNVGSVWFVVAP